MKEFIPYPFYADKAPIDISFVFENEKPAGKHGFIKAVGEHFEFEDGTVARFWGTNFNGGANFPSCEYSEKLAKRLAAFGVNIIRLHQLDAEWDTPNIFSFSKGKRVENTRNFDPESMKRLDYMLYCMKKEGIYCYIDMFTYRKFKSGDGVLLPEELKDEARPYSIYSRKLIELQKEHAENLWNHYNEYTGLKYKDDPMFVMAEVINEGDLFLMHDQFHMVKLQPYVEELKEMLKDWTKDNEISYDCENVDFSQRDDEVLIDFRKYLQEKYYTEMIDCLRKTGVRIPITGNNWRSAPENVKTQKVTDYVDGHNYFYDWRWGEFEKCCGHKAISETRDSFLYPLAQMNINGMPFFVSEWDMPWPNSYRAESPIYCAAMGNFLGWSGYCIHTYAYSTYLDDCKMLGKEVSSAMIGGTPYREGIFSTWNDPAKFGLFYHAALITRRRDVTPANNSYAVIPKSRTEWNDEPFLYSIEQSKIYTEFDEKDAKDKVVTASIVDEKTGEVKSDTGELYRSWEKKFGTIDTPMTKCIYGSLKKNGKIDLDGLSVECDTDFAVIAMSSLTKDSINKSNNILLTTVARSENTDFKMDGDELKDYGRPPVLCEVVKARIELKTEISNLQVWAVNAEGFYIGKPKTEYTDGVLKIELGDTSRSIYYLIVGE